MEFQSYNAELAIANLLFKRVFDNIRIERTDNKGNKTQLKVQCLLGQRSRILKNLENPEKRGNMKLPMIIIKRNGYSRDGERLNNLHNEVKYEMTSGYRNKNIMTPVPITIDYEVSIVAKYPEDLDKIASNFMVFFNSDIYVSAIHPKFDGIKMNNQIIMSDSVNEDHPDEFDGGQDDIITSSFTFTYKTYLFSGLTQAKLIPKQISSEISTVLSTVTKVIPASEIDEFQKNYPNSSITAEINSKNIDEFQKLQPNSSVSANVQVEISSEVPIYGSDPDHYEGIPIAKTIDFGLYVVPNKNDFEEYMTSVDNELLTKHEHVEISGQVGDNYYDVVDNKCTLEPYVDKLYWKIDGTINKQFPENVRWYNDKE